MIALSGLYDTTAQMKTYLPTKSVSDSTPSSLNKTNKEPLLLLSPLKTFQKLPTVVVPLFAFVQKDWKIRF